MFEKNFAIQRRKLVKPFRRLSWNGTQTVERRLPVVVRHSGAFYSNPGPIAVTGQQHFVEVRHWLDQQPRPPRLRKRIHQWIAGHAVVRADLNHKGVGKNFGEQCDEPVRLVATKISTAANLNIQQKFGQRSVPARFRVAREMPTELRKIPATFREQTRRTGERRRCWRKRFNRCARNAAAQKGKMQRAVAEIFGLRIVIKTNGESVIRKRLEDIGPFLQFETSFCPSRQPQVTQLFPTRDPSTQSHARAELLARLVEMKNEVGVRLHPFGCSLRVMFGSMRSVFSARNQLVLWLAVLIGAAGLRFAPIAASLPYIDYVDEGYALHQAIDLLNRRTVDPGWYGYPSLPAYLTAGTLVLAAPVYGQIHGHSFRDDLPPDTRRPPTSGYDYDQISPPALILAGRCVAALLSVATVFLAGIIARKLQDGLAGFLALIFTATCPALVLRGSNVVVDTFATFFVLLTLYFCERFRSNASRRAAYVAAAGFAAGLSLASKYPGGAVFIAVVAAIWMLPVATLMRLRFILLAIASLLAGIFVGAPATFLHLSQVVRDVSITASNYRMMESNPGYFGQAVSSTELGWFVAVAGCVGFVLMVRRPRTHLTAFAWILFALALLAPFVGKPFQPFRNLLSLAPLLGISTAIAMSELADWMRRRSYRVVSVIGVTLIVAAAVASSVIASIPPLQHRMAHRDSRVQAIDWLQQHAKTDDRVLGVSELAILSAEWKRVVAHTTVVSWCEALDLLDREQFDYVVAGDFDTRNASDPAAASTCLARWKEEHATLPAIAEFGSGPTFIVPYLWRTNDERVVIRGTSAAKSP
jgi:hypothetical protein